MPKSPPARSPLPWKVGAQYKANGISCTYIHDKRDIGFASITGQTDEEKEANANYICDAANLLPEMVKFLEEMVTNEHTTTSLGREGLEKLLSRAKEALGER